MKEDLHEHLEHHKLSMVRPVAIQSIDNNPWGHSGHDCNLLGLVRPLKPLVMEIGDWKESHPGLSL